MSKTQYCLLLVFAVSIAGCQSSGPDWPPPDTRITVKYPLAEVSNAILISSHADGKHRGTNELIGISYILNEFSGTWGNITATTINASAINSNETAIAVRCATTHGDIMPAPVDRHRNIERLRLSAIKNVLKQNFKPSASQ